MKGDSEIQDTATQTFPLMSQHQRGGLHAGDLVFGAKPQTKPHTPYSELVVWLDLEQGIWETLFSYTPKRLIKWYDKSIALSLPQLFFLENQISTDTEHTDTHADTPSSNHVHEINTSDL